MVLPLGNPTTREIKGYLSQSGAITGSGQQYHRVLNGQRNQLFQPASILIVVLDHLAGVPRSGSSSDNGVLKSDRLLAMPDSMVVAFVTYSIWKLLKQIQELLDRRVGGLHTFLGCKPCGGDSFS